MLKNSKNFNVSNRLSYTIIAVVALILLGAGVYALTAGVAPDPGHTLDSISAPSGCEANTFLKWTGSTWQCVALTFAVNVYKHDGVSFLGEFVSGNSNDCSTWVYDASGTNVQLSQYDCADITQNAWYFDVSGCVWSHQEELYAYSADKTILANGNSYVKSPNNVQSPGFHSVETNLGPSKIYQSYMTTTGSCVNGQVGPYETYKVTSSIALTPPKCDGAGSCVLKSEPA